jgi:D-alanyl-D-alanine endopeptidase (penicillin-binding protein 7)
MYQVVEPRFAARPLRTVKFVSRLAVAIAAGALSFAALADDDAATAGTAATSHHTRKVSSHASSTTRTHATVTTTRHAAPSARAVAGPASFGQLAGLHGTEDPIGLRSSVALVVDQDTNEVLFSKNPQAVLPIASITKLMTATVVLEAHQPMDEVLTITDEDIDTEKGTHSRLVPGTKLTRNELLHLALMASENRAAHALGRNYPGGLSAAVAAMNAKAQSLGMNETHYVEPTGLSSSNQSSARDLAVLVNAAHQVPLLREYTTTPEYSVALGSRQVQFHTTNRLVSSKSWDIGLQKTGFINEAGQCLVMQAQMAGRKLIMVLLDSAGKYSRIADAERLRKWIMAQPVEAKAVTPAVVHTPAG